MKFDAILFDCDGVLVDSESITIGVLRQMLGHMGWQMTQEECMGHFVGHLVQDQSDLIFQKTGQRIDDAWTENFRKQRNQALQESLVAIPHIHEALNAITKSYGEKIACASGADRGKVVLQLTKTKLLHFFEGRIFSGVEMPKSKPAPDVYLAAAAALGVDPKRCAVIEDSTTGATAGVAAGCTVFAFCPDEVSHSSAQAMRAVGASHVFTSMADLPALLV
ncbi:HAD family phosphatase [Variovorax sp. PCZ-1]|uniref:HAD family hydrolase n=1 Tax=Variovorax sp. PCZ-1 TaxID=2835533 RepID=UPI001BCD82BA|nr:HAD family phosphatase [Variovorax sp. PCZ-1]MBS7806548.1 HAD family phosphatase [Variovorax sp. PCZ-1]